MLAHALVSAGSRDKTIKLWQVNEGQAVNTEPLQSCLEKVSEVEDGSCSWLTETLLSITLHAGRQSQGCKLYVGALPRRHAGRGRHLPYLGPSPHQHLQGAAQQPSCWLMLKQSCVERRRACITQCTCSWLPELAQASSLQAD